MPKKYVMLVRKYILKGRDKISFYLVQARQFPSFLRRSILKIAHEIPFRLFRMDQLDAFLKKRYQRILSEPNEVKRLSKLNELGMLRSRVHPPRSRHLTEIQIDDIRVTVNISDKVGGDLFYGLGFETGEFEIVKRLINSSDTFIDVGANIGLYTMYASRLVGATGSVHAFEPLAEAYDLLEKNVRLNNMTNVKINPVALGEQEGEAELYINQESTLTSLGQTGRGNIVGVKKVPVWTLDAYAFKTGLEKIDFLKIDIEGFEGHVLRGASHLLERSEGLVILCELAEKNYKPLNLSVNDVMDWMKAHHYAIWEIENKSHRLIRLEENRSKYNNYNFIFVHCDSPKLALIEQLLK